MPPIRCMWWNDKGENVGRESSCSINGCSFIHPWQGEAWKRAQRRNTATSRGTGRGGRGSGSRGRGRGRGAFGDHLTTGSNDYMLGRHKPDPLPLDSDSLGMNDWVQSNDGPSETPVPTGGWGSASTAVTGWKTTTTTSSNDGWGDTATSSNWGTGGWNSPTNTAGWPATGGWNVDGDNATSAASVPESSTSSVAWGVSASVPSTAWGDSSAKSPTSTTWPSSAPVNQGNAAGTQFISNIPTWGNPSSASPSWGCSPLSAPVAGADASGKPESVQVDAAPLSEKAKGKQKEVFKTPRIPFQPPRDRTPPPSRSPTPFSESDDHSSAVDPQDVHKRKMKLFLRILKLRVDLQEARRVYERFIEEKNYNSTMMAIQAIDDAMVAKDTELSRNISYIEGKIKVKEEALLALPDIPTMNISRTAFHKDTENVLKYLEDARKWLVEARESIRILQEPPKHGDAMDIDEPLPSLLPLPQRKWPSKPSQTFIESRFKEYQDHIYELENYFEEIQMGKSGVDNHFEQTLILDDFKDLQLKPDGPGEFRTEDENVMETAISQREQVSDRFEEEMGRVRKIFEEARAELDEAKRKRDEVLRMKDLVSGKLDALEKKQEERTEINLALAARVKELFRQTRAPPVPQARLRELAREELLAACPAIRAMENSVRQASQDSADRIEKVIDRAIEPSLVKVKQIRAQAHSLAYNVP